MLNNLVFRVIDGISCFKIPNDSVEMGFGVIGDKTINDNIKGGIALQEKYFSMMRGYLVNVDYQKNIIL